MPAKPAYRFCFSPWNLSEGQEAAQKLIAARDYQALDQMVIEHLLG